MLLNILFFAFVSRATGGGFPWYGKQYFDLPRWLVILMVITYLALVTDNWLDYAAWLYLFCITRFLATDVLLDIMQGKREAVRPCILRTIPALPAIIYLGAWLMLLQPLVYWLSGFVRKTGDSVLPECVVGGIYGGCL